MQETVYLSVIFRGQIFQPCDQKFLEQTLCPDGYVPGIERFVNCFPDALLYQIRLNILF